MDRFIDLVNLFNITLGGVAFCFLFARTSLRKNEYPREVLSLLIVAQTLILALLFTSFELILRPNFLAPDSHLIAMSVVIMLVKLNLMRVLWVTRNALYRTGARHSGSGRNADTMDVDEDFADHPKEGT